MPTDRALELAEPIAEILLRVRSVVASAEPFDPATSTRRFTIGAPDAVSAVLIRGLLDEVGPRAPGIDLSVRQAMLQRRTRRSTAPGRRSCPSWRTASSTSP